VIMVHGGADVPSIDSVWRPSASLVRFFVDDGFRAKRCHGCLIEIVGAMEVGLGRYLWVEA
jgi:hypothetical protein